MVHERVEHVFRRDHVTADQQFGFAHRLTRLLLPGGAISGKQPTVRTG